MPSALDEGIEARESWSVAAPTVVRVALAGCGAVGSALVRELDARRDALAARHGVSIELARVLVRDVTRPRDARFDRSLLTSDVGEFLSTDADVVIEAIGGLDPAGLIARTALGQGRKVVTANKLLLAACGTELTGLARRNATTLRFDAAVGGGVPILRTLEDALGAGVPARVRGILNGTANFVITRLESGASYEDALRDAREAGFAEADASRDLDGRDAADKIALIAWAAFGAAPELLRVRRASLLPSPDRFVRLASRVGGRVRQVGECRLDDGIVSAAVEPLIVAADSSLGRTRDEGNHVDVFAGWRAPLCASGPGAGGAPTATALLSDLVCTSNAPRRSGHATLGTDDARRSDWAIEVIGASSALHRAVPSCGLVRTDDLAETAWTIAAARTPAEIVRIVNELELLGANPIVARLDDQGLVVSGEVLS
ncbi:MAG: homoserine dehydrogenase [Gemmatimonadaceae bacterium]